MSNIIDNAKRRELADFGRIIAIVEVLLVCWLLFVLYQVVL